MAASPELRAMVLAAGHGKRLRPLTDTVPKPMIEVGGRPLIDYALDCVARAGIRDVVVNLHHLGEQIRDHIGDGSRRALKVRYSVEEVLQDTGGGIRDARRWLEGSTFVTMNADTIVDVDLAALAAEHRRSGAFATMLLRKDPAMERFGLIETERDGRVGRFLGRERKGCQPPLEPWMYTGVQVLDPGVFDYLDVEGPFSITKVSYPAMLADDRVVRGQPFDGAWITVGTPAELESANAAMRDGRHGGRWTTQSVER